jgi:NTP pyrophosphatase (non-canonical NTP hydrolase)
MSLDFTTLKEASARRAARWHREHPFDGGWTGGDWGNALAGEVGEACNIIKKIRRVEEGYTDQTTPEDVIQLLNDLGRELADVIIYADLVATMYSLDLGQCVATKFNETSEKWDFPERLPL